MKFCTAINCMDGRTQVPVIRYLKERFNADYVDMITEPGPNGILAKGSEAGAIESILKRLRVSVEYHQSAGIAVVGHHNCAGNPTPREQQYSHTLTAVEYLQSQFPNLPVIGLWVGENWQVSELKGKAA